MHIETSTVQKLMITGLSAERLDPIAVYLENFGPGEGKITITSSNESWSRYWGAMGEKYKITSFFLETDNDYLAVKLGNGLPIKIDDFSAIADKGRKEICENRRDGLISKEKARELFDMCDRFDGIDNPVDVDQKAMYEVFGDDWWDCIPKQRNPKFEYLCSIIDVVKAALREADQKSM